MATQKIKPTLKQLMVLRRMVEEDLGLCVATHLSYGGGHTFFHVDLSAITKDSYQWFHDNVDGRSKISENFYKWGWIAPIPKNKMPAWSDEHKRAGIFAWYDRPYLLTPKAVEYWNETGKAAYDRFMEAARLEREKVERLVTIKKLKHYRKPGDRHAGMLVRVIRESNTCIYVEVVEGHETHHYLQGSNPSFIDREQITIDGVTLEQYMRLRDVEDDIQAEIRALRSQEDEAIAEIKRLYDNRKLQNQAEYDSRIQDVLK